MISTKFINAGYGKSEYGHIVPAPLLRRKFDLREGLEKASIKITGLGFYRLFINGTEITKGYLSPYISNPDTFVYFDEYEIAKYLTTGENVIGIMLGNGIRNCLSGKPWGFNIARFRGEPITALKMNLKYKDGAEETIEADSKFKAHKSPILYDDIRFGEVYDARLEEEIDGWNKPGFDDSTWDNAKEAEAPRGDHRICTAPPIKERETLTPVKIWQEDDAFIYDFGQNGAGLLTIKTSAERGRKFVIDFAECIRDGRFYNDTLCIFPPDLGTPYVTQTMEYNSSGKENQVHTPSFTYFGFRYARVRGITKEEAVPELLTFTLINTQMKVRGDFSCSDETLNSLQKMTRASTYSNMLHIPTDCPHREKSGWTGDASLSAVHMLLNLEPDEMLLEWLRNVARVMNNEGAMPGIIPAADWGYYEWNGPAWESALVELPYRFYELRGDLRAAKITLSSMLRYITYTTTKRDKFGLIHFGLGDWCAPHDPVKAPVELTDTIMCYDIANKASVLYRVMCMPEASDYCSSIASSYLKAIRDNLIDHKNAIAAGNCQTSQAMSIYYGIFTDEEVEKAVNVLLKQIKETNGHIDCGVLGARVIFRVLADHGHINEAYKMMTLKDAPSYGEWVERGDTTLAEDFNGPDQRINSRNHHFLGDISAWFIDTVCGIKVNPELEGADTVCIAPNLPDALKYANAYHITHYGKISVDVKRNDDNTITYEIEVPEIMRGKIKSPEGYIFSCEKQELPLISGTYTAHVRK